MSKENLKILLIQIRKDIIKEHEFNLVVEMSGLTPKHFDAHDVFLDTQIPLEKLHDYDGVVIGGSGAESVTKPGSYLPYLEDVARYCRKESIPFLGLCFGFQVAVKAFGGIIVNDKEHKEVGTYMMYRTPESDTDPLIGDLPRKFLAGCGHQDRAATMPIGLVNSVWSDLCPFHYAADPQKPFFLVQFHPELWRKEDNAKRVKLYQEKYGMSDAELEAQLKLFTDAPESWRLIKNFIDRVAVPYHEKNTWRDCKLTGKT